MDPKEDYNQQNPSRRLIKIDETGSPSSGTKSNIESFLDATRLSVPLYYFPETTCDIEIQPFFLLNDLWESFEEWSAYGAGVPFVINGSDSFVQYFVPYLSGIQIFPKPGAMTSDSKSRDTSSDGSIDCEFAKNYNYSSEHWFHHHLACENTLKMRKTSLSDEHSRIQEDFTSYDGHAGNPPRVMLYEFFEKIGPYNRMPLAEKITVLATKKPVLKRLRSCDIHPVSWVSVAWYPIYRIPAGLTLKASTTRFLTYHYLSKPIRGIGQGQAVYSNDVDGISKVSLPAFGMGTFMLDELISEQNSVREHQIANSLMQDAEELLRHLPATHHDAEYFGLHTQTIDDSNYESNELVPVSTIRPALNTGNDTF